MSTKAAKMGAAPAGAVAPEKKKGKGRLLLFLILAVVVGGGGVGAGLWAMGFLTGEGGGHVDQPELVARDDAGSTAIAEATEKARAGGKVDPHVFQASYHEMERPFTSNLRGGQAFVQIGIGMSTYYDKRVIDRLEKHDMAIRSAILMTLAEQDPLVLASSEGKQALREALKKAVNDVLTIKEGFGGIEEVFFTSFVTQ